MAATFHFDHHAKEALKNRKRFSIGTAFLLMVLVSAVGIIVKQNSYAATYVVAGSVRLNGAAYPGITITTCVSNPSGKTDASGNYYISLTGMGYCSRASGAKSYYHLTPIYITAEHPAAASYEMQESTVNCYHRTTAPCPTSTSTNSAYGWDRGTDGTTSFMYTYKFPTAPSLSGSSSTSQVNLSWSVPTTDSGVGSYLIYNNGSLVQSVTGSTQSASFAYNCGSTYSYQVQTQDTNGERSSYSGNLSGSVSCPPPPPPPATPAPTATPKPAPTPIPTPIPTQTQKPTTTTQVAPTSTRTSTTSSTPTTTSKTVIAAPKPGVVAPITSSSTSAPADISAPAAPEGFTASTSNGGNDIELSWTVSTDSSGIKGYNIERSIDQATWETINSADTDTSYDDKTIAFSTHYYYRLTASDNAGNTSDYVKADATSSEYQANIGSNETQLASDDGIASVTLPAGAISTGADCSVIKGDASVALAKGQFILDGPYQLLCKDAEGNQVQSFSKPLTWSYQFKTNLKGYGPPLAIVVDDSGKAAKSKSVYNKKLKTITFDQTNGSQALILASKTKGVPVNLIIGILFVIAIFAGVFFFVLRRRQKENYSDYIRSKYYDI
jgi:hypothetical protein